MDGFGVDLARDARQFQVHAIDHAQRARRDEVAGNDTDGRMRHGRVRQALAEGGLDIEAQLAGRFLGAFQRGNIRDAHAVVEAAFDVTQGQLFRHLRPRAVDDGDIDIQRMQQGQIMGQHLQRPGADEFTGEGDHEGLAAKGVDVGRDGAQPLDELGRVFH